MTCLSTSSTAFNCSNEFVLSMGRNNKARLLIVAFCAHKLMQPVTVLQLPVLSGLLSSPAEIVDVAPPFKKVIGLFDIDYAVRCLHILSVCLYNAKRKKPSKFLIEYIQYNL